MNIRGLVRVVLLGALLALALASSAGAVVVRGPNGRLYGVYPKRGVNPSSIPGSLARKIHLATDTGAITWQGGPVLHTTAPYLIFWDPNSRIPGASKTLIERYMTDLAAASTDPTDDLGVIRQYYDGTGYSAAGITFGQSQVIVDTTPLTNGASCEPVSPPVTNCVTDSQIATEISNLITARHLGTGTGANAPVYFMVTPPDVNACQFAFSPGNGACAIDDNGFCAYHGSFPDGPSSVIYAVIPLIDSGKGCQDDSNTNVFESPNTDIADNAIDNMTHEYAESITDPLNSTVSWTDPISFQEVADNCEAYGPTADPADGFSPNAYEPTLGGSVTGGGPLGGAPSSGTLYDQLINHDQYYTQTVWSNGDLNCETQPAAASPAPSFATTAPVAPGGTVTFTPGPISSGTWNFGDGSATVFTNAGQGTTHLYARTGGYTATLTYIDTHGNAGTITHVVAIGLHPAAAFTASASTVTGGTPVSFNAGHSSDPTPGGAITSYAWSFGDGSVASGIAPAHAFTALGRHTVTLTITARSSLQATTTTSIDVVAARITKVAASGHNLLVTVSGPGAVKLGSKHVTARKAGTVTIPIPALGKAQRKQLAQRHKLTLTEKLAFVPVAGPTQHLSHRITLRH